MHLALASTFLIHQNGHAKIEKNLYVLEIISGWFQLPIYRDCSGPSAAFSSYSKFKASVLFTSGVDTWEPRILRMSMWSGIVLQTHTLQDRGSRPACYLEGGPSYIGGYSVFTLRSEPSYKGEWSGTDGTWYDLHQDISESVLHFDILAQPPISGVVNYI